MIGTLPFKKENIMKKLLLSLFVLFTFAMPTMAYAQDAGPVEVTGEVIVIEGEATADPTGLFLTLFQKIQGGEWLPAFGASLMLLVFAARKLGGRFIPWLKTKLGGYVLSFGLSLAMAVATALLASQPITLALAATALGVAWAAAGGWETFRDLLNYLHTQDEPA